MTWKDLVKKQIDSLENDRKKEVKKRDKVMESDSPNKFAQKVEIEANIKSLTESINVLYILLGRECEVTE